MIIDTKAYQPQEDPSLQHEVPPSSTKVGQDNNHTLAFLDRASQIVTDTWAPELAAITISILCSIAIGAILKMFDGRLIPSFPTGITLNAIIAILATVSKSSMLLSVSSCLGQLKWLWYQRSRPLYQLQLFEEASKGPWGALSLVFSRLGRSIAVIGAVVTVLALAFDPFVQQVINYQTLPVADLSMGSVARSARALFTQSDEYREDFNFFSDSVLRGLWNTQLDQQPSCTSSNCVWDVVSTVGVCHRCEKSESSDLTDCSLERLTANDSFRPEIDPTSNKTISASSISCRLAADDRDLYASALSVNVTTEPFNGDACHIEVSWPVNTGWLVHSSLGSGSAESWLNKTFIAGLENPLVAVAFSDNSISDDQTTIKHNTTVCALDFCVRDYNISVVNGIPSIKQVKSTFGNKFFGGPSKDLYCWSNKAQELDDASLEPMTIAGHYSNRTVYIGRDKDSFVFCDDQNSTLPFTVTDAMSEALLAESRSSRRVLFGGRAANCSGELASAFMYEVVTPSNLTQPAFANQNLGKMWRSGLDHSMLAIADSLSQSTLNQDLSWGGNNSWYVDIPGQAITDKTFVQIRWLWLALPVLLNIVSAAFLVITIWATRRAKAPLWKSSTMALLQHGLEHEELSHLPNAFVVSEMETNADRVTVKLKMSKNGDRFALTT